MMHCRSFVKGRPSLGFTNRWVKAAQSNPSITSRIRSSGSGPAGPECAAVPFTAELVCLDVEINGACCQHSREGNKGRSREENTHTHTHIPGGLLKLPKLKRGGGGSKGRMLLPLSSCCSRTPFFLFIRTCVACFPGCAGLSIPAVLCLSFSSLSSTLTCVVISNGGSLREHWASETSLFLPSTMVFSSPFFIQYIVFVLQPFSS